MLYFTVWTGNGENLMSHIEAIKEQANFFHKNRLVVDIGTKEHLQKTGALENSKVVLELDTDAFAKARAKIAKVGNPTLGQHYEKFYSRLQGVRELERYRVLRLGSDILRYVAFTAYSDQAEQLVYHDADFCRRRRGCLDKTVNDGSTLPWALCRTCLTCRCTLSRKKPPSRTRTRAPPRRPGRLPFVIPGKLETPSPELPQDEAGLADPDAGSPSSSRGNWRPLSPELPQNEAGLVRPSSHELPGDVVDLSTLRFGSGREPPLVDPATEPEAFDKSIAACMRKNRRRREASNSSLYEEENFSARQDGEFVFQEKWPVTFTREDGFLRMIVESGVNAKNVKTRVVADIPKVLVEALARKRAEMVQTAHAQLEEIMSNPAVEAAVNALGSDAHLSIPSEHARGVKRMGAAYARAVTSGPKSRGVVKTWVLGTRAYGLFANIGALAYGDPVTKTFVALDLSQTVNGFMAHKLAQYAKTQDLAKVFSALADNPILNMAGIAANIFFFAQNVRNVAGAPQSCRLLLVDEILDADVDPGV
ncbi:hypothetical protein D5F01_LYC24558 [Larimichthys crocea]|uniref:Uncharacterized protein n=1 Tax=Larimichthys crocea TaxID=215358 RepID=A0A6G0HEQ0_LARCR|nr:hypothetical protein D5F01_LYC24558 [Larimichthys crocea]